MIFLHIDLTSYFDNKLNGKHVVQICDNYNYLTQISERLSDFG